MKIKPAYKRILLLLTIIGAKKIVIAQGFGMRVESTKMVQIYDNFSANLEFASRNKGNTIVFLGLGIADMKYSFDEKTTGFSYQTGIEQNILKQQFYLSLKAIMINKDHRVPPWIDVSVAEVLLFYAKKMLGNSLELVYRLPLNDRFSSMFKVGYGLAF